LEVNQYSGNLGAMRSYGQYCSVAKALDVVGDRWTLLIARELLLQGPCRYTDLKNGLPGIATNLLADRLRELEAAGLVRREEAAPPVATTLFHLTEFGSQLQPVLEALGAWGIRYMTQPSDGDEFRSHWLSFPVSLFLHDAEPGGPRCPSSSAPATAPRSSRSPAARSAPGSAWALRPFKPFRVVPGPGP
jgi:DNA-binding HxlR family transcriptional regulator